MRRVFRRDLSEETERKLADEQSSTNQKYQNGTLNVEAEWKRARRNKPLNEALQALQVMAGNRQRCMYCGDSHGTDIEHFWPKSPFPKRMFRWTNMLLCCTDCGRKKGNRFPLDNQQPLLIDPSVDNPWEFLDFDPDTGNITARYEQSSNDYTVKGLKTVEVLQFDRREAMARGYQRTFRRIKRCVEQALEQETIDAAALFHELGEADDHGLLGWCFDGLGSCVSPFAGLQANHPAVWESCLQAFRQTYSSPQNS